MMKLMSSQLLTRVWPAPAADEDDAAGGDDAGGGDDAAGDETVADGAVVAGGAALRGAFAGGGGGAPGAVNVVAPPSKLITGALVCMKEAIRKKMMLRIRYSRNGGR